MNFKKANIIIITLFITIVVGLIGLIVTKYIFNLIKVSSENLKYYKSYYVAYAGIETELLKLAGHGIGFEDKILSGSNTVKKNFSGENLYFSSKIKSLSKYIVSNPKSLIDDGIDYCFNYSNRVKLQTGDGILLPLFYDKNTTEAKLTGLSYNLVSSSLSDITIYYSGYFSIGIQQENEENYLKNLGGNGYDKLSSLFPGLSSFDISNKPFISIGAKQNSAFCIKSNSYLVTPYSYIQSQGIFRNRAVYLKVIKNHKWAKFTMYGIY